jgi:hypothetical protein
MLVGFLFCMAFVAISWFARPLPDNDNVLVKADRLVRTAGKPIPANWFSVIAGGSLFPSELERCGLTKFPQMLRGNPGSAATIENSRRYLVGTLLEEKHMRKALAVLATVATVGATVFTAPAQARGIGPGLGVGLAAGALIAGAAAAGAYGPYGYGPGYGYYGPGYAYGPYAYYNGPYYHHYYRHW